MAGTLSLRVYTGPSAGTQSAAQTGISLNAADALTGPDVDPGDNSFEKWLRLRVDAAPDVGVTNFWLRNTGDLPEGVVLKFGVTDTPATPTASTSTVATSTLESGRRYTWDTTVYSEVGERTRYLVIQEQVAADAPSGAIDAQALEFGWQDS